MACWSQMASTCQHNKSPPPAEGWAGLVRSVGRRPNVPNHRSKQGEVTAHHISTRSPHRSDHLRCICGDGDAFEGKGPRRRPQRRLGRRLEEVAEAVGGGHCRLRMPLKPALGVRGTVAGHRLGALEGGGRGVSPPPPKCIPAIGVNRIGGGGVASKYAGWYFRVDGLVWAFRRTLSASHGRKIVWNVRVGRLSLCPAVLLLPLGIPRPPQRRRRQA